ncbi:MAG: phage major capsid protein [Chloroflexota bacterium]
MNEQRVTIFAHVDDARTLEAQDGAREIEVTIIRPGASANGLLYPAVVLEASVPLFENAAAFADHPTVIDMTRAGGRSLRDLVGVYHSARWEPARGVVAVLRFNTSGAWAADLAATYIADRAAGRPVPPIGISADLLVSREAAPTGRGHRQRFTVTRVAAVNSADLVFRPAAGGTFDRILNSEENQMPEDTPATTTPEEELTKAREARQAICATLLDTKLAASNLPTPATEDLRARFANRVFEASEIDDAIGRMRALVGGIVGSPIHGAGASRLQVGRSSMQQFQSAVDQLFGVEAPAGTRKLSGIREAYLLLTGDYDFTGQPDPERWSVAREAGETLLATMDQIVASAANKRLVADYKAQPKWWEPIAVRANVKDMRVQNRILLNDFGALAVVAENGPYVNTAWGDKQETYTPAKKGNLVYVSMEAILNDDTNAFTRLPKKLAAAAAVTINETASALFTDGAGAGPNMADGTAVFLAGRANIGAAALDATSLAAGVTAMLKMTNTATKRIGVYPRFLLVPPDLALTAATLTQSHLVVGSPNNDINVFRGMLTPIVVPNWTDTNNWYLMADPAQIECIEIGFLNGREAPEILVQNDPHTGLPFTNDALVWKVRFIYGAGWLDFRGAYGAVVA